MRTIISLLAACLSISAFGQSTLVEGSGGTAAGRCRDRDRIVGKGRCGTAQDVEAHYYLGDAYGTATVGAGMFKAMSLARKSREQLDLALQLDPNHLPTRSALVEFYVRAPAMMGGDHDKAVEQANEIKKRDPLAGHRAFAYIATVDKKLDLAQAEYQAEVKEFPNQPRAHYDLGAFYISQKSYKEALDTFETSIKIDPNYMPGWFQIGHMAALMNADQERGEQAIRKYLGYAPKRGEPSLARAHYWLGSIYEKQGKKAEAKASYGASLKLNPTQKDVQEALKRVS